MPSAAADAAPTRALLWRPGDIVACYGRDLISRAITCGTARVRPFVPRGLALGPSHVALVAPLDGRLLWVESTLLCQRPCVLRGAPAAGWQVHEIGDRLDDYRAAGGAVDVYRLPPHLTLSGWEEDALGEVALGYFREAPPQYDTVTALLSGLRCLRLTSLYPAADFNRLFCSELVATCLQRVGRLCIDENASRHSPASLLRRLVRAGTYRRVRRYHPDHVEIVA